MTVTYASSGFWTGYKAVFDAVSGTYSFEATATSGLTYGSGKIGILTAAQRMLERGLIQF